MKKLLLLFIAVGMIGCKYTRDNKDSFDKSESGAMVFSRVSSNLALATNIADMVYKVDLYMRTTDPVLKDSIKNFLLWEYRIEYYGGTFTLKGQEREWVIQTNGEPLVQGDRFWIVDYRGPYGALVEGVCAVRKSMVNPDGFKVTINHAGEREYGDNNLVVEVSRVAPLEVLFRPNSDYWVEGSGQLMSDDGGSGADLIKIDFRSESPLLCGVTSYIDDLYRGVCLREGQLNCDVSGNVFKNDQVIIKAYNRANTVYADITTNGVEVKDINITSQYDRYR